MNWTTPANAATYPTTMEHKMVMVALRALSPLLDKPITPNFMRQAQALISSARDMFELEMKKQGIWLLRKLLVTIQPHPKSQSIYVIEAKFKGTNLPGHAAEFRVNIPS